MFNFQELHIGLTNRCRLACPECPRNSEHANYIMSKFDIDIEHFKNFLLLCDPKKILFCGNWGDPIYAKDFIGLVRTLKSNFPEIIIMIHTNGSGKRKEWWEELMSLLADKDMLVFSIDGTPDNYSKYRINSDWDSVELAVKTCIEYKSINKNGPSIEWKHLVFSYNEHTIHDAYRVSKELGFDKFYLQQSLVDETHGAKNTWLKVSRPFEEIERDFNATKE